MFASNIKEGIKRLFDSKNIEMLILMKNEEKMQHISIFSFERNEKKAFIYYRATNLGPQGSGTISSLIFGRSQVRIRAHALCRAWCGGG